MSLDLSWLLPAPENGFEIDERGDISVRCPQSLSVFLLTLSDSVGLRRQRKSPRLLATPIYSLYIWTRRPYPYRSRSFRSGLQTVFHWQHFRSSQTEDLTRRPFEELSTAKINLP